MINLLNSQLSIHIYKNPSFLYYYIFRIFTLYMLNILYYNWILYNLKTTKLQGHLLPTSSKLRKSDYLWRSKNVCQIVFSFHNELERN